MVNREGETCYEIKQKSIKKILFNKQQDNYEQYKEHLATYFQTKGKSIKQTYYEK